MVPCSTLTLSNPPLLLIPAAVVLLTPSIVFPPRLSLMLLAPITRPSPGQFRRSFFYVRVVRDHLTTRDMLSKRRARADRKEGRDGRHEDAEPNQRPAAAQE